MYKFFAEAHHFTPEQVDNLRLIPMCILLGAITPDHHINRLPPKDYMRFTRTKANRATLKRVHKR